MVHTPAGAWFIRTVPCIQSKEYQNHLRVCGWLLLLLLFWFCVIQSSVFGWTLFFTLCRDTAVWRLTSSAAAVQLWSPRSDFFTPAVHVTVTVTAVLRLVKIDFCSLSTVDTLHGDHREIPLWLVQFSVKNSLKLWALVSVFTDHAYTVQAICTGSCCRLWHGHARTCALIQAS